jgi:hypothetical protein
MDGYVDRNQSRPINKLANPKITQERLATLKAMAGLASTNYKSSKTEYQRFTEEAINTLDSKKLISPEEKLALMKMAKARELSTIRNKRAKSNKKKKAIEGREVITKRILDSGAGFPFTVFKTALLSKYPKLQDDIQLFSKISQGNVYIDLDHVAIIFQSWQNNLSQMKKRVKSKNIDYRTFDVFEYGSADLEHRIEGKLDHSGELKFGVKSNTLPDEDVAMIKRAGSQIRLPGYGRKEASTKNKYDRKRAGLRMGIAHETGTSLFARMMAGYGDKVKSIRTEWGSQLKDNLNVYSKALEGNGGNKIEAAKSTWTYKVASLYGFTEVEEMDPIDDNISFKFTRPNK